jgi:hypothetical protein
MFVRNQVPIQNGDFVKFAVRSYGTRRPGAVIRYGYGVVENQLWEHAKCSEYYLHVRSLQQEKNGRSYAPVIYTPRLYDIKLMPKVSEIEKKRFLRTREDVIEEDEFLDLWGHILKGDESEPEEEKQGYYVCECGAEYISDICYSKAVCLDCGKGIEMLREVTEKEAEVIKATWEKGD